MNLPRNYYANLSTFGGTKVGSGAVTISTHAHRNPLLLKAKRHIVKSMLNEPAPWYISEGETHTMAAVLSRFEGDCFRDQLEMNDHHENIQNRCPCIHLAHAQSWLDVLTPFGERVDAAISRGLAHFERRRMAMVAGGLPRAW